jgi:hypothetical protein
VGRRWRKCITRSLMIITSDVYYSMIKLNVLTWARTDSMKERKKINTQNVWWKKNPKERDIQKHVLGLNGGGSNAGS